MKLAEALIERAELQRNNAQLIYRISTNTKVQDGDEPAEKPELLIEQYEQNMDRLLYLVTKINETNAKTKLDNNTTVAQAIATKDLIGSKIHAYKEFYESATIKQDRYSQKEVKFVRCVDAKSLQDKIDNLSKQYRELDTKLQGINWTVDLL